jgi:hypothetical protein
MVSRVRTSAEWLQHFKLNRHGLLDIPWELGAELSAEERAAVGRSIAEFQRGESSEGRHLIRYATDYARDTGDVDYVAAIRLFIAEEQRHARDLARFLGINGVPLARTTPADAAFRWLRNLCGTLEVSISVLILAEIIAQVYYKALQEATRSLILRRLCAQLRQDEDHHVQFQAEQLGKLRAGRGPVLYRATMLAQRLVFLGCCAVVWIFHRQVLQRGRYGLAGFLGSAWHHFSRAFQVGAELRANHELESRPHLGNGADLHVHEPQRQGDLAHRVLGDVGGHLG